MSAVVMTRMHRGSLPKRGIDFADAQALRLDEALVSVPARSEARAGGLTQTACGLTG